MLTSPAAGAQQPHPVTDAVGHLDLDDIGPLFGQDHARERGRDHLRCFDDSDAFKWSHGANLVLCRLLQRLDTSPVPAQVGQNLRGVLAQPGGMAVEG